MKGFNLHNFLGISKRFSYVIVKFFFILVINVVIFLIFLQIACLLRFSGLILASFSQGHLLSTKVQDSGLSNGVATYLKLKNRSTYRMRMYQRIQLPVIIRLSL